MRIVSHPRPQEDKNPGMKKKTTAKEAPKKAAKAVAKPAAKLVAKAIPKEKPVKIPVKAEGPTGADLELYQGKLEELRDMLMTAVRKKKEEAIPEAEVGDEGDVAMRSLARDLVFEVTDNEHRLLEECEAALRRIEKGTYGVCEANGEKIAIARLKAIPYARYCINCQGRFERT